MNKISFNDNWTCAHLQTPNDKINVTIPHDAMIAEKRTKESLGGINTGWFEGYDYLYEKEFFVPEFYVNQNVFFEFEGVYHNAEVFINGKKAAYRPYGYSNFYADADEFLHYGQNNTIKVIARNADQPNSRWYSGAGIYRPVWMYVGEKEHILRNGVKIKTLSITQENPQEKSSAEIEVEVKTNAAGTVKVEILDGETQEIVTSAEAKLEMRSQADAAGLEMGAQADAASMKYASEAAPGGIARTTLQMSIQNAKLWNVDTPHQYQCQVTFTGSNGALATESAEFSGGGHQSEGIFMGESTAKPDVVTENFGIRTIAWNAQEGFLINGKRVIIRGACIHHDHGILGAATYPEAEERRIRILKENGYNAIRSAHNPCAKSMLDACDKLGMLVLDEFVDVWYIHKTEYDYVNYFPEWYKQDLFDIVEKDYNHPSVVMYSTGNEVSETGQEKGIALTKEMTEYLHSLDNSRPVTCGINIFFNFLSSIGFGVYSDKKAQKEVAQKSAAQQKKKAVGSQFFNNMAGLLGSTTMKTGATLHGCDVKTRDAFANMDIAGYNYGIYRYQKDLKKYPNRLILGSETFCDDAYSFWEQAKKEPRLIGDFVWAGMDYLGEVGVGSWEYKDYAPEFDHQVGWITAGSGRIDLTGKPLAEALYTKVAFELEDTPQIAVRPVNHTGDQHSPSAWKMTDAISSWSWNGCEGRKAIVEVYARADHIALYINQKIVGLKTLKNDCKATFEVAYQPGTIEAVAFSADNHEIGRNSLTSADDDTVIRILPEEEKLRPDQLSYIRLQYTDEKGVVKPLERGTLEISLEGADLVAFGNACPFNARGYNTNQSDTYYGEALAIIRVHGDRRAGNFLQKLPTSHEQTVNKVKLVVSDGTREAAMEF